MVVDHDIGMIEAALEVARLHVDHRDLVEALELAAVSLLDLDFEQAHHVAVFRTGHQAEAEDRRGQLVAPKQGPQRHRAGDAVRVGVVL